MVNSVATGMTSSRTDRTEAEPDQPIKTRRHRESPDEGNGNCHIRYFLGKTGSNDGIPALEKEIGTEGEALVESLRHGVPFYTVQEFRAVADLSGRRPQLTKEVVTVKKN